MLTIKYSDNLLGMGYLSDLQYDKSVVLDLPLEEVIDYVKEFNLDYEVFIGVDGLRDCIKMLQHKEIKYNKKFIISGYDLVKFETKYLKDLLKVSKRKNINLIMVR